MKRWFLPVFLVLLLIGCGGGGGGSKTSGDEQVNPGGKDGTPEAVLEELEISPGGISLPVGISTELKVTGFYSDGSDKDLTEEAQWSVSNADAVQLLSDSNGVMVKGLLDGASSIVTAQLGEVADEIRITVTTAELKYIDIEPASAQIPVGLTKEFRAKGKFSDGTILDITSEVSWSFEPEGVASINNGLVRAETIGDTVLVAELEGIEGDADLSVVELDPVSLTIIAERTKLPLGTESQLKAEAGFKDGSKYDLTQFVEWSSSHENVATISNADGSRGVVSADYIGTTTITALFETGVEASLDLEVTEPVLECIHVTPEAVLLSPGDYQSFKVFGVYSHGVEKDITLLAEWNTADAEVAAIVTRGLIFADGPGEASITVSYDGKEGKTSVRVIQDVTEFRIVSDTDTLLIGQTIPLKALAKLSNGLEIDVTPWTDWSVDDDSIASFPPTTDMAALLTAHKPGETNVNASWDGFKAIRSITIE